MTKTIRINSQGIGTDEWKRCLNNGFKICKGKVNMDMYYNCDKYTSFPTKRNNIEAIDSKNVYGLIRLILEAISKIF